MKTQQVFGCGVDIRIFKSKYESLDKKDQLRLECVARRVWLTVKIRYEMSFYGNPFAQSDEDFTLTDVVAINRNISSLYVS